MPGTPLTRELRCCWPCSPGSRWWPGSCCSRSRGHRPLLLLDDQAAADRGLPRRRVLGRVRADRLGGARRPGRSAPASCPVTLIAVLLLAATLIHLDKFDLDSLFGWFWLVVYCAVPPVLAVLLWRRRRPAGAGAAGCARSRGAARRAACAGGRDGRRSASPCRRALEAETLWPWTLTPLTARASARS